MLTCYEKKGIIKPAGKAGVKVIYNKKDVEKLINLRENDLTKCKKALKKS